MVQHKFIVVTHQACSIPCIYHQLCTRHSILPNHRMLQTRQTYQDFSTYHRALQVNFLVYCAINTVILKHVKVPYEQNEYQPCKTYCYDKPLTLWNFWRRVIYSTVRMTTREFINNNNCFLHCSQANTPVLAFGLQAAYSPYKSLLWKFYH